MNDCTQSYRSFLLRLRRLDNGGEPVWVFTLDSADGSSRHEFHGLWALTDFLAFLTRRTNGAAREATNEDEQRRKLT